MEEITNYIQPELMGVSVVLYFIGMALKQLRGVPDRFIPLILGAAGIVLCSIWTTASFSPDSWENVAMVVFTSIVQGILAAGLSTYVNQMIKQMSKKE